ncbi:MAG: uncharacterized protein JWM95_1582 [Gemmatimonadetes bacterium]|nr:uncharacterized protein [Gemmatimonadota bacterium]
MIWQTAVIERIEQTTPRVKSFFFRVALEHHDAGQHVDIRLTAQDGYQAQRSYSIASAPGAELLELVVEHLPEGEVSSFLHDVAVVGDEIEMRGPIGGHFVWRQSDEGPLLLIAGGSGIAPLMAMLRTRPATDTLLIYSTRTWEDVIFRDELLAMDARVRVIFLITRELPRRAEDFGTRIDRGVLGSVMKQWGCAPRHVYVCGATSFVEAAATALVDEGIPAAIIKAERYGGA